MGESQASLEALKTWSFRLFWITILVPVLGALVGGTAGVIRYYVERREKLLSAQATNSEIQLARNDAESARQGAEQARQDLANAQQDSSLAEKAAVSWQAYRQLLKRSQDDSAGAVIAKQKVEQIKTNLSLYETPLPYGEALLLVKVGAREVSTGVERVSVKDLFVNLNEPNISTERRRKLMAHLVGRIDMPDSKAAVLREAHQLLFASDNLPAMAATCGILHWLVRGNIGERKEWVLDFERWKVFAQEQLAK